MRPGAGALWRSFGLAAGLLAATVTLSTACSEDVSTTPRLLRARRTQTQSSAGCSKADAPTGLLSKQPISVKNNARTYDLFVPDSHGKKPLPLIFVFHGSGGDGAGIRRTFDLERHANGEAIFVYPDGFGGEWDLESKAPSNIDMLLFDAILEAVSDSHCVDTKRVFATGYSAGGYFSNQLACRRGGKLRAIASHSGGGPFGQSDEYGDDGRLRCPERAVAALVVHGTADGDVKLEEAHKSREHWRRVNGCRSGPGDAISPSPCVQLAECSEDRPVVYCEIPGLGHEVWPENGAKLTWELFSSL